MIPFFNPSNAVPLGEIFAPRVVGFSSLREEGSASRCRDRHTRGGSVVLSSVSLFPPFIGPL